MSGPKGKKSSDSRARSSETDVERAQTHQPLSLWQHLLQDVDPKQTTGPLAMYCFMTGYMYVTDYLPLRYP
jgi:hypothetical protein